MANAISGSKYLVDIFINIFLRLVCLPTEFDSVQGKILIRYIGTFDSTIIIIIIYLHHRAIKLYSIMFGNHPLAN